MLFTEREIQTIRELYPTMGQKIAPLLPNHTLKSIVTKAEDMGLKVINHKYEYEISHDNAIALAMAIDCEGAITLRRWQRQDKKEYYHPKISIYNTNYKLIEWADNIIKPLPRYVSKRQRKGLRNDKWKHAYQIDVRGVSPVYTLLETIKEYFILKRGQADLVIEFCETRIGKPLRQPYTARDAEIFEAMVILNKKGPVNDINNE